MAGEIDEALLAGLERKLEGHVLVDCSACSIVKVPNPLREINEKAYEPQVISIGPYHHGKDHLKAMEVHKMNSLKLLLERKKEIGLEIYVRALEEMEREARQFYSESLDHIGRKELVEMMLLDGCFIIELIFESTMEDLLPNFYLRKVMRDLLLIENQLPFSVLSRLYSLSSCQPLDSAKHSIANKATRFFKTMMPGSPIKASNGNPDVKHLLGLLHDFYLSEESVPVLSSQRLRDFPNWQFIRSATELNEAGVEFQKIEGKLLFDIKFQKGVMSIPKLKINDETESILRNLVAYEQCCKGISSKRFTDYITFMDCLINTAKDVELLCRRGVLDNWLIDHKVVATMFNRLCDSVLISKKDFFYSETFKGVNEHCSRRWNLWKANLAHNYFNTPWALISFIAAVPLLLSTFLQTLFSILSYHHQ